MIGQVPTTFYCLNDVSVNSMSVFICAKLDELKFMYTLQNTLNAKLALAVIIINGTDAEIGDFYQ